MQDALSSASLKLLFYRYKDTVYYPIVNVGILFVVGVFLLFQLVIPQFSQWFSVQREVDTIKQNIKTMQENTSFLSSLDPEALNSDVQIVTSAYPFENDYVGIIDVLTKTSVKTGVTLSDFSLSVGDPKLGNLPGKYLMDLSFVATLEVAKHFISELEQALPLAAVTSIDNNGDATSVSLEFYYHGFPAITINQKEKLTPLSTKDRELLTRLRTWQIAMQNVAGDNGGIPDTIGSSSGEFPSPL